MFRTDVIAAKCGLAGTAVGVNVGIRANKRALVPYAASCSLTSIHTNFSGPSDALCNHIHTRYIPYWFFSACMKSLATALAVLAVSPWWTGLAFPRLCLSPPGGTLRTHVACVALGTQSVLVQLKSIRDVDLSGWEQCGNSANWQHT
jgi:hypothetical protein